MSAARPAAASATLRAVLLDFGGTLDADGVPTAGQFHRAYRTVGGQLDAETFAATFRTSDRRLADIAHIARLEYSATVAAQAELLRALLPDEPAIDWRTVAARVIDAARATAARNRPLLDAIHTRARLGVVSNFTGNVDRCLAELGLLDLFDTVADSAVVGHAKPDPELFRIALRALDVEPDETLMVGDNPFADVRAAAALGMTTCWIAPATRAVPDGCAPTYRIATLPELATVLGIAVPPASASPAR